MLVERLHATRVSVGENFRFGHGPAGDPALLAADARFETRVVPLVEVDGEIVSSSHIRGAGRWPARSSSPRGSSARRSSSAARSCTATGAGARWASRPPTSSPTRRSCARATASTWPAPTARAPPSASACARRSATGRGVLVEAYLIDRDVDLYGRMLRVDFLARLRGERRFDSVEALVEQMQRDVEHARAICAA